MKPRVYLAGPVHHAEDSGVGWRNYVQENFSLFEWIDPIEKYSTTFDDVGVAYNEEHYEELIQRVGDDLNRVVTPEQVVREDKEQIRTADALLVGWTGVWSDGTLREIEFTTNQLGRPVVMWWKPFEEEEDEKFIHGIPLWRFEPLSFISGSLEECLGWLEQDLYKYHGDNYG